MTSPEHRVWNNGVCGGALKDNGLLSTTLLAGNTPAIPVNEMLMGNSSICLPGKVDPQQTNGGMDLSVTPMKKQDAFSDISSHCSSSTFFSGTDTQESPYLAKVAPQTPVEDISATITQYRGTPTLKTEVVADSPQRNGASPFDLPTIGPEEVLNLSDPVFIPTSSDGGPLTAAVDLPVEGAQDTFVGSPAFMNGTGTENPQTPNNVDAMPSTPGIPGGPQTPGMAPGMPPNSSTPGLGPQPGGPMPPGSGPIPGGPGVMGGPLMPGVPQPGGGPMGEYSSTQQQSHIFVYTTGLANKAAEMVLAGQTKSIIAYHLDQPATQQFLQKHPLKQGQFHRNPAYPMGPGMRPMGGPGMPPNGPHAMKPGGPDNSMNSVAQWVQQQNDNLQQRGVNFSPNSANPPFSPTGQSFGPGGPSPIGPWPPGQGPNAQGGMQSPEFMMDQGGPGFPGGQQGFNMMNAGGPSNLLQSKVPNENLTQEQLHRREERLANLRKIQQMLFPDQQRQEGMMPNGPGGPQMGPPGMMGPDKGPMGPGMMPGQPGPMMSPNQQMIGGPDGMPAMGPMGPDGQMPPQLPPNWETMNPAQRDWVKLQHEFYFNKRRKMQMDQMKRMEDMQRMHMGMRPGGPGGPGPPPPYSLGGMRRPNMPMGASSPTSPNGPHMGSSGHPSPAPSDPFMFPGGPRHPMMGPRMPGYDPSMDSNMGGGMFMRDGDPRAQHPGGKMPMIHMAGNPEQFNPEGTGPGTPSSNTSGANKPPPSYQQAQKRKRSSGDDMDELYKKLQPAPSPQQFSYLHPFDGQELTITKQLNAAYKESADVSSVAPSQTTNSTTDTLNNVVQSPKPQPVTSNPADRNTPATTVINTASPHPVTSVSAPSTPTTASLNTPIPTTTSQNTGPHTPQQIPQNSMPPQNNPQQQQQQTQQTHQQQAQQQQQQQQVQQQQMQQNAAGPNTQRLTHFDNPSVSMANNKSTLNNITSASLANLAKGVEHLSHQMQQDMMQGGPFHNIQIQGQMSDIGENGPGPSPGGPGSQQPPTPGQQQLPSDPSSASSQPQGQLPSVNNTYVNANLSIQQLNIQSIQQSGNGPHVANPAMQTQNMNSETMSGMPPATSTGDMTPTQQSPFFPNDPMAQKMAPGMGQPQRPQNAGMQPQGPMSAGHMVNRPPQSQSPSVPIGSPGYRPPSSTPVCNANVQIQAKAPNTIQYLPANPPTSNPGPMGNPRPEMPIDMMGPNRFPSPSPTMESKLKMPYGPGQGDMMMDRMNMPHGPAGMSMHMNRPGMPGGPGMPGCPPGGMPGGPGGMPSGPGGMSMQQQQFMMQANGPRMQGQMSNMQFGRPSPGPMPGMMPGGPGGMNGPGGPNSMGMMSESMMQGQQMQGQNMLQMQSMGGPPNMRGDPNSMMGGPPQPGFNSQYPPQQFPNQMYPQGAGGMPPGMQRPMSPGMHAMMQSGGPMGPVPMGPGGVPMGPSSGGPPNMMGGPGMPGPNMNQYSMMP